MVSRKEKKAAPPSKRRKTFGRLLKAIRIDRGYKSARSLALEVGLQPRTVRNIETGKALPHNSNLTRILNTLKVTEKERRRVQTEYKLAKAVGVMGSKSLCVLDVRALSDDHVEEISASIGGRVIEVLLPALIGMAIGQEQVDLLQEQVEEICFQTLIELAPRKKVQLQESVSKKLLGKSQY